MLYKVNALAGSGKTYTAARWAVKFAGRAGCKIAIVQPSKILINQTYNDILEYRMESKINCRVKYFYGDETRCLDRGSVKQQIMAHLRETDDGGEIILMTQAAFLSLPYWHRKEDWIVIIDEIPAVDKVWDFKLPKTHRLLTDHIDVEDFDPIHYRVIPRSNVRLSEYQSNPDNDDVIGMFSELSACILNEHWSVYCRKEQWHRHHECQTEHGRHTLSFFVMLEPSVFDGYRDVIIMGAMFDESLLNLYWVSKGLEIKEHEAISSGARYSSHDNGALVTFKYLLDEDWSKRTRDTEIDGKPLLDWCVEQIQNELHGQNFVWVGNNDVGDDLFGRHNERLPGISNGMNKYQHVDNVVFLSALNRTPGHYAFLKSQGLDPDYVKWATGCQSAYQSIMRGSIRNPDNTNPKVCIVPDQRTAEYLARYFSGCQIGNLGGQIKKTKKKPGRKPKTGMSFTGAERQVRLRAEKTRQLLKKQMELVNHESCNENTIDKAIALHKSDPADGSDLLKQIKRNYKKFTIQMFDSIYSSKPDYRLRLTNTELVQQLRDAHAIQGRQLKNSNFLISAAVFDADLSEDTNRGLANIQYCNGVWFDNDGGDLSPEDFHKCFPDLHMITMNTFSGDDRWRAFFPTKSIMTVEVHQIIVKSIIRFLNDKGYHDDKTADKLTKLNKIVKRHGFDVSKFTASSLFYAPMPTADGEGFFNEYQGIEIDPIKWVKQAIIHEQNENAIAPLEFECDAAVNDNENKIEYREWDGTLENCYFKPTKKIAEYQSHAEHSDARYTGIFGLAMSFISRGKLAGYPLDEWQLTNFIAEIDGGYHDSQDRKRIPTAVKNALRKAG
ncbi:DEAD/DEAH box helicase [Terasakiella pusilla]|uniref:DEAD/DEAH box helicase n=1 Tax=Terasakiella pusilla TaxID=64973 RepID=UPI0004908D06|nr:DEAD/DEAH box helicase [Terasakiella pusilla]